MIFLFLFKCDALEADALKCNFSADTKQTNSQISSNVGGFGTGKCALSYIGVMTDDKSGYFLVYLDLFSLV